MRVTINLLVVILLNVFICGNSATTKKIFHLPAAVSEKILEGILKCITKLNFDAIDIGKIKEGKYTDDDSILEAIICSNTETGYGTSEGRIHVEIVMKEMFLDKPEIKTAMDICEKDYGKPPVENFRRFLSCFRKEVPVKVRL